MLTADPVNIKNPPSASVNKEHHPNTFSYLYFYAKHKKQNWTVFYDIEYKENSIQ